MPGLVTAAVISGRGAAKDSRLAAFPLAAKGLQGIVGKIARHFRHAVCTARARRKKAGRWVRTAFPSAPGVLWGAAGAAVLVALFVVTVKAAASDAASAKAALI